MALRSARFALVLGWLAAAPAAAQEDDPQDEVRVFAGASMRSRFDDGPHIGPDARNLRYEHAGRWIAATGGEIALVGVEGPPGALALTLGGLLEVSNEDGANPVPFQLLRAVVGLGLVGATSRFTLDGRNRGRVTASVHWTHESDHPSGSSDVAWALRSAGVDLDNFSSFEHVRLGGHYEHWFDRWLWLSGGAALRLFPPPFNPRGGREQTVGVEVELRARAAIVEGVAVHVAVFWEGIAHDLDPAAVGSSTLPDLFQTVRFEAGFSFATESVGRLDLYTGFLEMDGRGIDFVRHHPLSWLLGLRGTL